MPTRQKQTYFIGTAAWALPKASQPRFAPHGSHLERYASRLRGVEINSSFYRDHKSSTYAKWAAMVPEGFRFAVKLSKAFSHLHRLGATEGLREVINGYRELGSKLGVILVQLPPSLAFNEKEASRFFSTLRKLHEGGLALEPRHLSWTADRARRLLEKHAIAKVIADPERCPYEEAISSSSMQYYRLHGSPAIYKSNYDAQALAGWESRIRAERSREVWCVFDNTALGHATENALELEQRLGRAGLEELQRAA